MSLFIAYGQVASVVLIGEPSQAMATSGRKERLYKRLSHGYAYVEMPDHKEALTAISEVDGRLLMGLPITVLEAMPMTKLKTHR